MSHATISSMKITCPNQAHPLPQMLATGILSLICLNGHALMMTSLKHFACPIILLQGKHSWTVHSASRIKHDIRSEPFHVTLIYEIKAVCLSVLPGQQQLLCLARVLLRRPRIVCLDECTASVDPRTAELMQELIAKELSSATIIQVCRMPQACSVCLSLLCTLLRLARHMLGSWHAGNMQACGVARPKPLLTLVGTERSDWKLLSQLLLQKFLHTFWRVVAGACLRLRKCLHPQIAHRLESVMGCDQVAVMDMGRVVECGPPTRLLGDASSHFSALHSKA